MAAFTSRAAENSRSKYRQKVGDNERDCLIASAARENWDAMGRNRGENMRHESVKFNSTLNLPSGILTELSPWVERQATPTEARAAAHRFQGFSVAANWLALRKDISPSPFPF